MHGGHLGHVTSIMSMNFHFIVPKSLQRKFGSKWTTGCLHLTTLRSQAAIIVSEKSTVYTSKKNSQGQVRVTIYINFVEFESQMLHAKFKDHRTSGSGEEDF